jgi:hypothetical protein
MVPAVGRRRRANRLRTFLRKSPIKQSRHVCPDREGFHGNELLLSRNMKTTFLLARLRTVPSQVSRHCSTSTMALILFSSYSAGPISRASLRRYFGASSYLELWPRRSFRAARMASSCRRSSGFPRPKRGQNEATCEAADRDFPPPPRTAQPYEQLQRNLIRIAILDDSFFSAKTT